MFVVLSQGNIGSKHTGKVLEGGRTPNEGGQVRRGRFSDDFLFNFVSLILTQFKFFTEEIQLLLK